MTDSKPILSDFPTGNPTVNESKQEEPQNLNKIAYLNNPNTLKLVKIMFRGIEYSIDLYTGNIFKDGVQVIISFTNKKGKPVYVPAHVVQYKKDGCFVDDKYCAWGSSSVDSLSIDLWYIDQDHVCFKITDPTTKGSLTVCFPDTTASESTPVSVPVPPVQTQQVVSAPVVNGPSINASPLSTSAPALDLDVTYHEDYEGNVYAIRRIKQMGSIKGTTVFEDVNGRPVPRTLATSKLSLF